MGASIEAPITIKRGEKMPLYKPKFLSPSTLAERSTVDATKPITNEFSCIVDGNVAVRRWEVNVYDLNTGYQMKYGPWDYIDNGNGAVFYPTDNKNNYNVLNVMGGQILSNSSIENGHTLQWQIKLTGVDGSVVESAPEVFYCNSTPTLSLVPPDNLKDGMLTNRETTFTAEYVQAEGVPLQYYGWKLVHIDSFTGIEDVIINTYDKDHIYSASGQLSLSYNGFIENERYKIMCKAVTQRGVECTDEIEFTAQFPTSVLGNKLLVKPLYDNCGVLCSWGQIQGISGLSYNADGEVIAPDNLFQTEYPISKHNSVDLTGKNYGAYIDFRDEVTSNIDIPEDTYIRWSGCVIPRNADWELGRSIELLFLEGYNESGLRIYRRLYATCVDSAEFLWQISYEVCDGARTVSYSAESNYSLSDALWYIIDLSPIIDNQVYCNIKQYTQSHIDETGKDILYFPEEDLYPGEDIYPQESSWEQFV